MLLLFGWFSNVFSFYAYLVFHLLVLCFAAVYLNCKYQQNLWYLSHCMSDAILSNVLQDFSLTLVNGF